MLSSVWTLFLKDLKLELRGREGLLAMLVFALIVLVLLNFAFEGAAPRMQPLAPGILWVAFTFAGVLGFNRSFVQEKENRALEGARLAPIDPGAIYLGKWLSSTVFMLLAAAVLIPLLVALFDLPIAGVAGRLTGVLILGTSAFCAAGTLFAGVASNTRMCEVMLPILLFPVAIPVLLAAVECTAALLGGDSTGSFRQGVRILIGCNLIYLVLSYLIFPYVLEE